MLVFMADHLILSLQPPSPPLSSSSSLHRRWALSRRLPSGIRFSVSQFRFSFQVKFVNCISPSKSSSFSSPSPNFATEKFDLVSTTQLKDGSYVFRFGDANEIERNLEIEAKARCIEIHEEAKASEVSDTKIKSDIETGFKNVIKIKDRKKVRSTTKRKKETPSSVTVLQKEDKVKAKVVSVSSLSSIASVAETIASSSTDDKLISEKVSVNEIRDYERNPYQQLTENHVEVQARPRSSTSQDGSQLFDDHLKEVAHVSTIELDDNLDVSENQMKSFEAVDNLVVESTATSTVSPDEVISTSKATHHSVEEIAKTPTTEDCSLSDTKTDNGSLSKTTKDTKGEEDLQPPTPETVNLASIEVSSNREEELVSKAFYLDSGFASLESPFKALAGREDAYFISGHNWLGIADGVSQWSFEGIIRGTYAQELMNNCQKIISNETDPLQVLYKSVNETKSTGSSTALIAHLHNNELHIANIGDSGFMVIRNKTVLQKSSPMFHHFCFPLRITQSDDVLKLAEVYSVNLEEGDVVITATDGLFDNLFEKEIVSIVCKSLEQSLEPKKIAELIAARAQEVGRSEKERTPFEDEAKEEGYDGYKGGKLDAVTVIVSLVKTVCI